MVLSIRFDFNLPKAGGIVQCFLIGTTREPKISGVRVIERSEMYREHKYEPSLDTFRFQPAEGRRELF
ncbi:MAG: hypothetical protein KJ666_16910 [Bacteroidetes bacterium]|nr:hypothetical protein [Bacteroidota bacterium]MBU2584967.1 hypothetical protein [Bacteroidota bacterium]